ncbi:MAG: hypothetical protein WA003_00505 [Desulfuromonadaceae bacterium]
MTSNITPRRNMMKQQLSVILAAALFAATPALAADPAPANGTITPFNCDFEPSCEVSPGIYGALQAPATSKFNLSVGGFIKLDYVYNSVNLGPTSFLTPSAGAPKSSSLAAQKDQSIFSVRQSRLWFKSDGPKLLGAKSRGYLEFDFHNTNANANSGENLGATPRLRQAYGNLDWGNTQLLFGQAGDTFTGGYTENSIDFSGGTAGTGTRNPQIRLTQRVNLTKDNSLKFSLALQQPYVSNFQNGGVTANGTLTNVGGNTATSADSWTAVPNVVGQAFFISKALGVSPGYFGQSLNNFTIGVFGLYGKQDILGVNKSVNSYGAGAYTFIPVLNSKDGKSRAGTLTVEGQGYVAGNLPNFYGTAASVVGTPADPKPAKGYGVKAQTLYFPTQDLSFAAGYGRRGARDLDSYKGRNNFEKYNQTIYANASYDLNAAIRVAVEYQNLFTKFGNVTNVATAGSNLGGTADSGEAHIGRLAFFYFF